MTQDDLISQLRAEVHDVKECFNQYSYQSAGVAAALATFILDGMNERPWTALAAAPVIIVLLLVARIGIFKYSTANRNLGFQLHLERLDAYDNAHTDEPQVKARIAQLRVVGWEEALRAWRVVHSTMFMHLYTIPDIKADRTSRWWRCWPRECDPLLFRTRNRFLDIQVASQNRRSINWDVARNAESYSWWSQRHLVEPKTLTAYTSQYHAGHFLTNAFLGLIAMQWCYFVILAWGVMKGADDLSIRMPGFLAAHGVPIAESAVSGIGYLCIAGGVLLTLYLAAMLWLRQQRLTRRREILEDEFLSIHSTSIAWCGVLIAHTFAMSGNGHVYDRYTERLARLAETLDVGRLPEDVDAYIRQGVPPFKEAAFTEGIVAAP